MFRAMFQTYIIYSESGDQYYTGYTSVGVEQPIGSAKKSLQSEIYLALKAIQTYGKKLLKQWQEISLKGKGTVSIY